MTPSPDIVLTENGFPGLLFDRLPPKGTSWNSFILTTLAVYRVKMANATASRAEYALAEYPYLRFTSEVFDEVAKDPFIGRLLAQANFLESAAPPDLYDCKVLIIQRTAPDHPGYSLSTRRHWTQVQK